MSSGLISSSGYLIDSPSSFGADCSSCPVRGAPALGFPPSAPNWKLSTTISVRYCFFPSSFPSHERVCMRPSTYIGLPFLQYCAMTSAVRPKATTLWNSVASCFAPLLSLYTRLVARPKFATLLPDGRAFSSGSRVRLPYRNTLFRYIRVLYSYILQRNIYVGAY